MMEVKVKNFSKKEFECRCCGKYNIDERLIINLQALRNIIEYVNKGEEIPLIVNSGCRCTKHNKAVGGVANSKHLCDNGNICMAADITAKGGTKVIRNIFYQAIKSNLFTTIIYYRESKFIHLDIRKRDIKKYWIWNK